MKPKSYKQIEEEIKMDWYDEDWSFTYKGQVYSTLLEYYEKGIPSEEYGHHKFFYLAGCYDRDGYRNWKDFVILDTVDHAMVHCLEFLASIQLNGGLCGKQKYNSNNAISGSMLGLFASTQEEFAIYCGGSDMFKDRKYTATSTHLDKALALSVLEDCIAEFKKYGLKIEKKIYDDYKIANPTVDFKTMFQNILRA